MQLFECIFFYMFIYIHIYLCVYLYTVNLHIVNFLKSHFTPKFDNSGPIHMLKKSERNFHTGLSLEVCVLIGLFEHSSFE